MITKLNLPKNNTQTLKNIALGTAFTLASVGTLSAGNMRHTQLKADSIVLTNQIKSIEKNMNSNDYDKYDLDSTVDGAKQSLIELKQLRLKEKKAELEETNKKLNQIKKNENENKMGMFFTMFLGGILSLSIYKRILNKNSKK